MYKLLPFKTILNLRCGHVSVYSLVWIDLYMKFLFGVFFLPNVKCLTGKNILNLRHGFVYIDVSLYGVVEIDLNTYILGTPPYCF